MNIKMDKGFKITSSQRKLLKEYNPEGLPDFRTREWKKLDYDDKDTYIAEQLAIAKENKKNIKKNIIGNVKFNFKEYNDEDIRKKAIKILGFSDRDLRENELFGGVEKEYYGDISYENQNVVKLERFINKELEFIRLDELKKGYIRLDYLLKDNLFWGVWVKTATMEMDDDVFTWFLDKDMLDEIDINNSSGVIEDDTYKTSSKDTYNNNYYYFHYFPNDIYFDFNTNPNKLNDLIKVFFKYLLYLFSKNSNFKYENFFINKDYVYKIFDNVEKNIDLKDIKMKEAFIYNLEGYENQEWNTNNGKCVIDYIKYRYGKLKGLKIACSEDELINVFGDKNAIINGVNTYQISNFCEKYNIPLYAYDEDYNLYYDYYPEKSNHNYPSMMFKIINNHFYPIPENKRRALINKKIGLNINSNLYNNDCIIKKNDDDFIILKKEENTFKLLSKIMRENKKIPYVKMYDGQITSIKINNNNYIFRDENDIIKKIVYNMGIEYKGQTLNEIILIIIKDKIKTSSPNIKVYNELLKAKKNRSFNGLINNKKDNEFKLDKFTDLLFASDSEFIFLEAILKIKTKKELDLDDSEVFKIIRKEIKLDVEKAIFNELNREITEIKRLEFIKEQEYNNNDIIAYDINKCYSSIMYNPIEDWIILDVDNEWEDYNNNDEIKLGLYYIETCDNLLFKGNNIYSSAIVKKGLDENIISKDNIIKVLYANKSQDKDLFVDIIDEILKISEGDKDIYKFMINCISGMMGKNKMTYTKGHINKSLEHIFTTIHNYKQQDNNIHPFIRNIDDNYYLYGFNKENKIYDINIPIYIQILDQSNIKLYNMIKDAGGELIGRKVDCAIIKNPKNKLKIGDKWGDYRLSSIPKINNYEINNNIIYEKDDNFKLYDKIIDSDDYENILDVCLNNGGCLLIGNAGTGKSYVINEISKKLNVVKITPTNKSALNIRGQTIHRFLKLNKDGKIPRTTIENIKNKKYDLIIIDEISMISKDLWKKLLLLKEETKINFLLVGDNKQLPPIEDDGIERDYFNSSIVKYLTNYNKINLQVKKRYDEKLSKILEDVENINKNDLGIKSETKFNICFLNKTRKEINKYWNNKEKILNSILIKADENDEMTQDIYLYEGLPLISRRNLEGGDKMINNEKFILNGYDNEFLFVSSERPNEEGDKIIHEIEIKINEIHKYFLLNYCSTTHKAQGDTITENFTIYDFNLMSKKCKYTALSRAKSAEQIIIDGKIINKIKEVKQEIIKEVKQEIIKEVKQEIIKEVKQENDNDILKKIDNPIHKFIYIDRYEYNTYVKKFYDIKNTIWIQL
jgi:hypothetical protein